MVQEQTYVRPQSQTGHRLTMQDRARVELTGITEVVSFDNREVLLETVEGALRFAGEGLHVRRLTLERGEVAIEGRVREISYHESSKDKTAGNFLGRLFR